MLEWKQTALSETPSQPGSTSWGNHTPRVVVDALFHDRATGLEFQAVNTHFDHRSRTSRLRSADVLRRIVSASQLPTIVTGDFNTDANTAPYDRLTGQGLLLDTWDTAEERLTDEWGTFLNYRPPRDDHKRIDWLLATPRVTVLKAAINVKRYAGGWPSDHAAIQAVVNLAGTAPSADLLRGRVQRLTRYDRLSTGRCRREATPVREVGKPQLTISTSALHRQTWCEFTGRWRGERMRRSPIAMARSPAGYPGRLGCWRGLPTVAERPVRDGVGHHRNRDDDRSFLSAITSLKGTS